MPYFGILIKRILLFGYYIRFRKLLYKYMYIFMSKIYVYIHTHMYIFKQIVRLGGEFKLSRLCLWGFLSKRVGLKSGRV